MAETNNQAKAWNFNKSNTHPWVFFKFFKLYKWFPDHAKHIFPRVLKRVFSPQRFFFFFFLKKHVKGLLQKSFVVLTLSWRRPLSYRNRSIDLRSKSMDCFLYDNGLRHERIKRSFSWMSLQFPGRVRFKLDGLTIWVTRMYVMGIRSTSSSLNLTYLALVSFVLFSFFLMCLSKQLFYSCVRKKLCPHHSSNRKTWANMR